MMKRAGKDPMKYDKRPLSAVMKDRIPYGRWESELAELQAHGYPDWQSYLKAGGEYE